jgi:uncharacterized protein (DUF2236 family)
MPGVLPSPEEYADLVPTRASPVWRYASDVRLFATAGYALLLQVAHPTVGAGVGEHSAFQKDPWGRLQRTLDYVNGSIYGGPELAGEIGRRVRAMHRDIKGVRPDGERYHALEPGAYAWVHATLADSIVRGHHVLGRRMSRATIDAFWADWLKLGRLIGVRERDLPAEWGDFQPYLEREIATTLADNPTVHTVLETLRRPPVPPVAMPDALWRVVRVPRGRTLHLVTVGLLPPALRETLHLPWPDRDARAFKAVCAASRAATPAVVGPLREFGPLYIRLRRKQLERGDVARAAPEQEPSWAA